MENDWAKAETNEPKNSSVKSTFFIVGYLKIMYKKKP